MANKGNWFTRLFTGKHDTDLTAKAILAGQTLVQDRFLQVVTNAVGVTAIYNDAGYASNVTEYTSNGMLYSIIKEITETASIAPFKAYRIKEGKAADHYKYQQYTGKYATPESLQKAMILKNLVYEEDTSHPINERIDRPSKTQSGSEYVINSIGFKLLTGNRFIYLNVLDAGANAGLPYEIYNLPPQYMAVVSDGSLYGVAEYRFNMGRQEVIPVERVIHSKYFNPMFDSTGGHLWGLSPLKAANRNISRSDSAIDRSVSMFQNAGAAGALVNEEGGDLNIDTALRLKGDINKSVRGTENAGKISLLNGKWNYLSFGMSANDMQLIDSEKFTNEQLCNIFRVPYGLFNNERATYENEKQYRKRLITAAVMPELDALRADWNQIAKLYKDPVYIDYDITVYPELQEDLEKSARVMSFAWWCTGNEKRLVMGQDEDTKEPMMSTYLVPNGLIPIATIGENTDALLAAMDNQTNDNVGGSGTDGNADTGAKN